MWGTPLRIPSPLPARRFIPTHVGNTSQFCGAATFQAVHPHACGEHGNDTPVAAILCGSSPRMWGTQHQPQLAKPRSRFIPTHVGNTHSLFPPQMRVSGSSPRMWGTLPRRPPVLVPGRFIPTHVGNTDSVRLGFPLISVHPHACGEHVLASSRLPTSGGSSPRMWGTQSTGCPQTPRCRFIPTHVGNTRSSYVRRNR